MSLIFDVCVQAATEHAQSEQQEEQLSLDEDRSLSAIVKVWNLLHMCNSDIL